MSTEADIRLTPAQRLTRGLSNTVAGPLDITRGAIGLVVQTVAAAFSGLRQQCRKSKARRELRTELAAAQELVGQELADVKDAVHVAVQTLPQTLLAAGAELPKNRRKGLALVGAGVLLLAGGAAAFWAIRRSRQPEASALPPSVHVEPKP